MRRYRIIKKNLSVASGEPWYFAQVRRVWWPFWWTLDFWPSLEQARETIELHKNPVVEYIQ